MNNWIAENNPRWNGGRTKNDSGYILVKMVNHPYAENRGYIREHRLVMEKAIGRYLTSKEDIHHLNGNKEDNRIENLVLCASRSEHLKKYHQDGGKKGWFKKGQIAYNKNGRFYQCITCKKEVWKTLWDLKNRKNPFCSLPCYWKSKKK